MSRPRLSRRLRHDERGMTAVFVAILMFAMLGMAALVVDVGNWYLTRRQAQMAADAAALAAVQDLPTSPSTATSDADSYVSTNDPGATATVTTPYNGDSNQINVSVTQSVSSVFGGVLGINSVTVSAASTAKRSPATVRAALFARDTNCGDPGIQFNLNGSTITGGVRSNGSLSVKNNANFGSTTYGGPNGCPVSTGNGDSFDGASNPTVDGNGYAWPFDYSVLNWASLCTYTGASFTFNSTIPSGIYCATGNITLNSGANGTGVTLKAASFTMNGGGGSITPNANADNLAIYQTGASEMYLGGNNWSGGWIFAPNATVDVAGNNVSGQGFIEAQDIIIDQNNFTFTGTGPMMAWSSWTQLTQ